MKKILSVVLAVFMIALAVPMSVFADTTTATDIVNNVTGSTVTLGGIKYTVVDSADDIVSESGNYYLKNDIELSAPILAGKNFTGYFNGGGHTITLKGATSVFYTFGDSDCLIANFEVA